MAYTFKHGDRPLEGITIQRAVGRGGFGEVYYAVTDAGKQVALKYLRESPEIELRGIAQVMNLKSPHLITIFDVKRNAAGEPFVIMEYVSGPSLRELMLAEPAGMGVAKAAFFLKGIAAGLSYLHERGIVHRDLKPGNIFYDDGYVKIGDYGLSKHISVSQHSGQTVSVGTVHYMAPEIGSGSYTRAIDIYALGVILFEMLTGRLPFSGASMAEILMRHLRDIPDLGGVPEPFRGVIAKALAKDPGERFQTVDEMAAVVLDSTEIVRSMAGFDATSLSAVRRMPGATDGGETITAPPLPPPPPLDVREAWRAGPTRRLEHLARRLEHKAAKLERRLGGGALSEQPAAADSPRPARRPQIFILALVAVAIAAVLGLLHPRGLRSEPPAAVPLLIFLVGGTIGPLLVHLRFLSRALTRNALLDRLAYGSMAALFMLPGYLIAVEEIRSADLARVILGPLAAIVLCDWGRRIEEGRGGKVGGWQAFWAGLIGLVAASVAGADECMWIAAGVAGGVSLLTQSAAGMWPVARVPAEPRGARSSGDQSAPAATKTESVAGVPGEVVPEPVVAPPPLLPVGMAQPSFVGRTANAGLAFLGKLLLLAGLLVGVGQGPFLRYAAGEMQKGRWQVAPEVAPLLTEGVPAGAVLVVLVVGSLLLIAARRRAGAGHFLRGCLGCGALLWAVLVAIVWGEDVLLKLFQKRDLSGIRGAGQWSTLIMMGISLGMAVVLLLWPAGRRDKPIVI